jgi:type I site-specific restriction endonuclease
LVSFIERKEKKIISGSFSFVYSGVDRWIKEKKDKRFLWWRAFDLIIIDEAHRSIYKIPKPSLIILTHSS